MSENKPAKVPFVQFHDRPVKTDGWHLRFPHKWVDQRGRSHPGSAMIYFRNELFASNLDGTSARKWLIKLRRAFELGQQHTGQEKCEGCCGTDAGHPAEGRM